MMVRRGSALSWLAVLLVVLHLPPLLAPWLAPYPPEQQDRQLSYAPPTSLHWRGEDGWRLRPFVYLSAEDADQLGVYHERRDHEYPLRLGLRKSAPGHAVGAPAAPAWRCFGVDQPASIHLWGTDRFGRDLFSRWLYGARLSLAAGWLAALLAIGLALVTGLLAGFYGGALDRLLMRGAELSASLPWLYLLIALRAFLPLETDGVTVFLMTSALVGLLAWARPARLIRGVALSARDGDAVLTARGFGASDGYLLRSHILPAVWPLAWVQLSVLIPRCILAEVTLSFLGLGVAEPTASLGTLLSPLTEYHVLTSYGWMFWPAVTLIVFILSYHLVANAIQWRFRIPDSEIVVVTDTSRPV